MLLFSDNRISFSYFYAVLPFSFSFPLSLSFSTVNEWMLKDGATNRSTRDSFRGNGIFRIDWSVIFRKFFKIFPDETERRNFETANRRRYFVLVAFLCKVVDESRRRVIKNYSSKCLCLKGYTITRIHDPDLTRQRWHACSFKRVPDVNILNWQAVKRNEVSIATTAVTQQQFLEQLR